MKSAYEEMSNDLKKKLKEITGEDLLLVKPPLPKFGDITIPCFELAKKRGESLSDTAKWLSKKIEILDLPYIESSSAANAFTNLKKSQSQKTKENEYILKEIFKTKQNYGKNKTQKSKILIESPGPNTNKPLHLGHVRNMCLGQSLSNLLSTQGNTIIPININNDRGIHICKSMLAYQKYGKNDSPEKSKLKPDFFVGKYYVLFNQKIKTNPQLEQEAKKLLQKWEQRDKKTIALWKKMNKWAFSGFKETYKKFNIKFEKEYYESQTYNQGKNLILEGLKNKIFQKDETNAILINLEKEKLDKKILLRADGTSVYITQDIYLAKKRYEDFKFDKLIYVVGNEQIYHFKVLFKILEKLNYKFAKNLYHFSYGMIELPSGKMKSREGKIVDADTLVNELTDLAKKEIQKRYPNIKESELKKRSEKIAMSAIKFYILKHNPLKDFTFNPEKSISFEGETGPYIQYSYARINSIIKKSKNSSYLKNNKEIISNKIKFELLTQKEEEILIKKLAEYPGIIKSAAKKYKISLIPHYLIELSQEFNSYYHNIQIIQENKELEMARLLLLYDIQQVLKSGLGILGIKTMGEM